jgi:hypothetical protein
MISAMFIGILGRFSYVYQWMYQSLTYSRMVWHVAKGAIFKKLRFLIINLRKKKFHKQDEFGIEG